MTIFNSYVNVYQRAVCVMNHQVLPQIFPGTSATPWHRICPRAPSAAAAAPKCPPSVTTLWMRPTVEQCHVCIHLGKL